MMEKIRKTRKTRIWALASVLGLAAPVSGSASQPAASAGPKELPRGVLIENVEAAEHPGQRYALYLPTAYRPDRLWPILYAFDSRERGKEVAELFRPAAEKHGWIVASSYNTRSDEAMAPGLEAARALWIDTHARLAIDDRRVYAAGFSGTVRLATTLGMSAPGSLAGVIGASAGFPRDRPPSRDVTFAFFGTVGDRDFNYYEMMDLEKKLTAAGLPHRIEMFEGGHSWPPADLAAKAVGWMELEAMKAGRRTRDAALVEALWAEDLARARSEEAAGRLLDALHTWTSMQLFAGLRDTAEAERKAAGLAASEAVQRQLRAREERLQRDVAYLEQAPRILARSNPENGPVTVGQIAAELRIPELKARAESTDREESLSARRVLNTVRVQTLYYLPRMYTERGDHDRAVFMLSLGAEISPEDPEVWFEIAAAHARKGKSGRKKALESLRKAVDKGWADRPRTEREPAFQALRQDEEFRQILARMTSPPGPLSHRPPFPRERGDVDGTVLPRSRQPVRGLMGAHEPTPGDVGTVARDRRGRVPPLPVGGGAMGERARG